MPDTFRYWGSLDPRGRSKPSVLAFVPPVEDDGSGEAVLRLYDPVDSWGGDWGVSASEFTQALAAVPAGTPIRLHVNSPGGEVWDAIAIMNALRAHRGTVTAVVDGIAASAASFIAASADRLVMQPNSELMIHDAWGVAIGPAATMQRTADDLNRVSDNIASVYAAKAGTAVAQWRAAMLAETWYSAQATVDAGLADEVGTGLPADAEAVAVNAARDRYVGILRARAAAEPEQPAAVVEDDEPSDYYLRRHYARRLAARAS